MIKRYKNTKLKRRARVRFNISGTTNRPRLTVYRSLKHIYAQIIDDSSGSTLAFVSDKNIPAAKLKKANKTQKASMVGELLAQKAIQSKITKIKFDRGYYKFHGRVKALAQAARSAGLEF